MGLRRRTLVLVGLFAFLGVGFVFVLGGRLAWSSDRAARQTALEERGRAVAQELRGEGIRLERALGSVVTGEGDHLERVREALDVDGLRVEGAQQLGVGDDLTELGTVPDGRSWVVVDGAAWQVVAVPRPDVGGRLVAARRQDSGRLAHLGLLSGGQVSFTRPPATEEWLVAASALEEAPGLVLYLSSPVRGDESLIRRVGGFLLDGALIAALTAAVSLLVLDRTVLGRLQDFARRTESIRAGTAPGARLAVTGHDELDQLAGSLNGLLDELEATNARLRHEALHDPLTGLANRTLLHDRLTMALARGARQSRPQVALLFLDLDRLKLINDHLGHAAGDHFLAEMGRRLLSAVRPGDTVARLGGDEFAVVLVDIADPQVAAARADAVLELMRRPISWRGTTYHLSASIGLAMAGRQVDPAQLVREADMAMYEAKASGRNRVVTYDAVLHGRLAERVAVEGALRNALEAGSVDVVLQPIVAAHDGALVGFEALARWTHPTLGVLSPSHFVPIAEESRLITAVDRYVLDRALASLARLRTSGRPLFVAVNHASRSMESPDLVDAVHAALARHGLPPSALILELPENQLARNEDRWLPRMRALAEGGVRFCMEDFGLGASSLSRFHELPIAVVKLDQTLVRTLGGGNDAVARAVLGVAAELGRTVIAEGVESESERERLRELGCGLLQGYLVGHPEPESAHAARLGVPPQPRLPDA